MTSCGVFAVRGRDMAALSSSACAVRVGTKAPGSGHLSGSIMRGDGLRGSCSGGRGWSVEVLVCGGFVVCGFLSRSSTFSRGKHRSLAASLGPALALGNAMELNNEDINANFVVVAAENERSSKESVKDENARWVSHCSCVVRTNKDYGLSCGIVLPNEDIEAPVLFSIIELWAPEFYASCSAVVAGGFTKAHLLIRFWCLSWNLTALFLWCSCNS